MKKPIFCTGLLAVIFGCNQQNSTNQKGSPIINPPTVVGNFPNTPFLFAIPTQGVRPIIWTAEALPLGLVLDASTGIISGNVKEKGNYSVTLTAANKYGVSTSNLTIKIGDLLALTPPMGWNSWNTFADKISDSLIVSSVFHGRKLEFKENGMLEIYGNIKTWVSFQRISKLL